MPELLAFLKWWLEKATGDNVPHDLKDCGLCYNVFTWTDATGNGPVYRMVRDQLEALFLRDDLEEDYPFGRLAYMDDKSGLTQHLNQKRLMWVRGWIAKLEANG